MSHDVPGAAGSRLYAGLIGLAALVGGGVAARQSWMQLNPPAIPECGPGLEFMLESFPLAEALRARGVPFVFATGYGVLPSDGYPDTPLLSKPVNQDQLSPVVRAFAALA